MLDDDERLRRRLKEQVRDEATKQTTLELGPWPEDPVHYALKFVLGAGALMIVTSMILGVEPGGIKAIILFAILGLIYGVLHNTQSERRRRWDEALMRNESIAIRKLRLDD